MFRNFLSQYPLRKYLSFIFKIGSELCHSFMKVVFRFVKGRSTMDFASLLCSEQNFFFSILFLTSRGVYRTAVLLVYLLTSVDKKLEWP